MYRHVESSYFQLSMKPGMSKEGFARASKEMLESVGKPTHTTTTLDATGVTVTDGNTGETVHVPIPESERDTDTSLIISSNPSNIASTRVSSGARMFQSSQVAPPTSTTEEDSIKLGSL